MTDIILIKDKFKLKGYLFDILYIYIYIKLQYIVNIKIFAVLFNL